MDISTATTILGAAKLVAARRAAGLGLLEAVTGREYARAATGSERSESRSSPSQRLRRPRPARPGPRGSIGFLGTAVIRDLETPSLDSLLVDRALVGGVDGHVLLDEKRGIVVSGGLSGSTVAGSPASVLRVQRAAPRYFQRPDAPHVSVDPTATSLSGWSGRLGLNKKAATSPSMPASWGSAPASRQTTSASATQTDRGVAHGQVVFRELVPDAWTRSRRLSVAKWWTFDTAASPGRRSAGGLGGQLRNYWQPDFLSGSPGNLGHNSRAAGEHDPTRDREPERRGRERLPPALLGARAGRSLNREFGGRSRQYSATFNLRPWTALTLSATPTYLRSRTIAQYLSTVPDATATATDDGRYVFGELEQTEWSIPLRVNLVLTPKLSLQLYTQALLSTGDYPHDP